jgi:arsenite methyltransferase
MASSVIRNPQLNLIPTPRPDYGIDAPGVVRNMCLAGLGMIGVGFFIPPFSLFGIRIGFLGVILILSGLSWIAMSIAMLLYAKIGKFKHRDRMLSMVNWRGDENVLDIGTGRGLLMIGAAKKLTTGKSIGIDIWNAEDLSDNKIENTMKNVATEGVEGRVELRSEDARKMNFSDDYFDVILSNLCIHNLYQPEQRERACREIARVLKPGGVALISDFRHTDRYAEAFREIGLKAECLGPYWKDVFPKLTIVKVEKPVV